MSTVEVRTRDDGAQWRLARFVVVQPVDDAAELDPPVERAMPFDDVEPWPVLDADGLLRFRGRWVAVPPAQVALVRVLLHRFQSTVSDDELLTTFATGSSAGSARKLAGAMHRLRGRVAECGLVLSRVRARGYILDYAHVPVMEPSEDGATPSGSAVNLSVD